MTRKLFLLIVWSVMFGLFSTFVFGQMKMANANVKNGANPETQLLGKWELLTVSEGDKPSVEFLKDGVMFFNCVKVKYKVVGDVIFVEAEKLAEGGKNISKLRFELLLHGSTLILWMEGKGVVYTRRQVAGAGKIQAEYYKWKGGSNPPGLVGQWRSEEKDEETDSLNSYFLTLYKNGTFEIQIETKSGDTATNNQNATGRWSVKANSITLCGDRDIKSNTFRLEKRNHPQTGVPMLIIKDRIYLRSRKKEGSGKS